MFVIAQAEESHPKGYSQAYADIARVLSGFSFLTSAGQSVRHEKRRPSQPVFCHACAPRIALVSTTVRDIRAFRLEQWSDFTPLMKQPRATIA
jgi:virulence-associated protein VapD